MEAIITNMKHVDVHQQHFFLFQLSRSHTTYLCIHVFDCVVAAGMAARWPNSLLATQLESKIIRGKREIKNCPYTAFLCFYGVFIYCTSFELSVFKFLRIAYRWPRNSKLISVKNATHKNMGRVRSM